MFMYLMQVCGLTVPAEGLPCNARDRNVTGSSLNREVFSIIGILESTMDRVARHGLNFSCNFVKLVNYCMCKLNALF